MSDVNNWVIWQERSQMLTATDRPHTRSTSTVWNTEGLVQIDVANIRSKLSRPNQPDQSV
jgi:hypothetical protein